MAALLLSLITVLDFTLFLSCRTSLLKFTRKSPDHHQIIGVILSKLSIV